MHPGFVNDKLVEAKPDRSSPASCALTGGKVCAHQIPAMVVLIQAFFTYDHPMDFLASSNLGKVLNLLFGKRGPIPFHAI